ncbi:hypothetical protein AB0B50_29320 [Streptomyces sp. NPDC041068]|uniref:hypothetical protein n=1 Tax=Streptomyces sp. NPDC041068 TaxID=3155130 RepID=UPI0033FAB84C
MRNSACARLRSNMGWTFKLHGGVAVVLGFVLLVLTALSWLPGTFSLAGARWLVVAGFALLPPVFLSALVRGFLARTDRQSLWLAFRCLPGQVQVGLAALFVSGAVMAVVTMGGGTNLQAAEMREGRYFALDTTPHARGRVEVSRSRYEAVLASDRRPMLVIPGMLFIGAAFVVLTAGEVRRADHAATLRTR